MTELDKECLEDVIELLAKEINKYCERNGNLTEKEEKNIDRMFKVYQKFQTEYFTLYGRPYVIAKSLNIKQTH